jgi:hypothetical protein
MGSAATDKDAETLEDEAGNQMKEKGSSLKDSKREA